MKNYNMLIDKIAQTGYETMFENKWKNLSMNSIDKKLFRTMAINILNVIWFEWKNRIIKN